MKTLKSGAATMLLFSIIGLVSARPACAHSQDDLLLQVHSAMRITGAHIKWIPNQQGTLSLHIVYDVTNTSGQWVPVPSTKIGEAFGTWAGTRQMWIERLGRDPNIPAMPRQFARRGRQYANGGSAVLWPNNLVGPGHTYRFSDPIGIGGFPSGKYAVTIEYSTTHDRRVIQSQVLYFDVP